MPSNTRTTPLSVPVQSGIEIWNNTQLPEPTGQRMEFPHLHRFKGHWYCSFRHALIHHNHLSGKGLILRSSDGEKWHEAVRFSHPEADVRDPRLSISADGKLMVNTSLAYLNVTGDDAKMAKRHSVTWLSEDGDNWQGPFACESGLATWRWDVAWHKDCGYSVGYSGKDTVGTLYKTRDGKTWEPIVADFFPARRGSEAALTFTQEGLGCCLLRSGGGGRAALGTAPFPFTEWQWQELDAVWDDSGKRLPLYQVTDADLGGPHIITTQAGAILGVARIQGTNGHPTGSTLFHIDPQAAVLTRLATIEGGASYPGLVEHDDQLWMTCVELTPEEPVDWKIRFLKLPVQPDTPVTLPATGTEQHDFDSMTSESLSRLALESDNRHVRLIATQKITDPEVLSNIALSDPSWQVRHAASKRCQSSVQWSDWYIRTDPRDTGTREKWYTSQTLGDKDWRAIPCPAMWNETFLKDYLGIAWYSVTFDLPDDYQGQDLQLLFGGVDSEASVYVNGTYVGERTAASSNIDAGVLWKHAFKINVSAQLLTAHQPNILHVKVYSGIKNGGIHQPVIASLQAP